MYAVKARGVMAAGRLNVYVVQKCPYDSFQGHKSGFGVLAHAVTVFTEKNCAGFSLVCACLKGTTVHSL